MIQGRFKYNKAYLGAIVAGLGVIIAGLSDSHLTLAEILTAVSATLVALGGISTVKNKE